MLCYYVIYVCVRVCVYRYIIYIFIIVFVLCRGMKIFAPTCRFVTDLILHFFAMYSYSIFKTLLFLNFFLLHGHVV